MSVEILKRSLELASADIDTQRAGNSSTKSNRKRKAKNSDAGSKIPTVSKKVRVKSIIEETLEKPKPNYLRENLRYLKKSEARKTDSEKLRKIVEAYDSQKNSRSYWQKHDWNVQKPKKKSIKKPCIFSEQDFKNWASTLNPRQRKQVLS